MAVKADATLPGHFDLGTLAPHTRYTIDIVVSGTEFADAISFETGEGQGASETGELRVSSVSEKQITENHFDPETCRSILVGDTCYDFIGVPSVQTFDVDVSSSPIDSGSLWVMETIVAGQSYFSIWPASCGKPVHFGASSSGTDYRVYNVGTNGTIRESDLLVGPLPPPPPEVVIPPANTDASGMSCDLAPSADAKGPGALVMALSLCAVVLGRRAHRRKSDTSTRSARI